jgi:WD40 repeat protein
MIRLLLFLIIFTTSLLSGFGQVNYDFTIKSEHSNIACSNFSPDGEIFATSSGKYIQTYYPGTKSVQHSIKTAFDVIRKFNFIDKEKIVVTGYNFFEKPDNHFEIWNIKTNILIYSGETTVGLFDLFPIDGDKLFVGWSEAGMVSLVKKDNTYETGTIDLPISEITAFAANRKTKKAVIGNKSGQLCIYDLANKKADTLVQIGKNRLSGLTVSASGKFMAVSDIKGNISIIEQGNNTSVKPLLKSHKDWIYSLSFSWDERYLSSSDAQHFYVWEFGKNIYSFQSKKIKNVSSISSVSFDPKGKFIATTGFLSTKVKFWNCTGLSITPFLDMKDDEDKTPPQILVTYPTVQTDKVTVATADVKIKGLAIDERGVNLVLVNNKKVALNSSGEFEVDLRLSVGENPVKIEATDINGNTAVKRFSLIRRDFDISDLSFEVTNHLLVIAIDQYASWPKLNNAVSDARKFISIMEAGYNFDPKNIIVVNDTMASRQGIVDGFKTLIEKAKANDNIVIYYSGHGHFDPLLGEGYWIPYDAKKGNDGDYLPNSFILQLIKKLESKHLFLIADACFSGSLFNESHRGFNENVSQYKSRWGLASGRLEYVSDGAAGEQSPFNKYLVQYLKDNLGREFSVSELIQYVKVNVANESDQAPLGNPLKNVGDEGGEMIFNLKN